MKLKHIKISNYRSFLGDHEFDVAEGVNCFVGPNNCGKSNLIAAIELALNPDSVFVPERDRPVPAQGTGAPPKTRITLTFEKTNNSSPQRTLIQHARDYELALRRQRGRATDRKGSTYAEDGEVHRVVTFGRQGTRQVSYEAKGFGAVARPVDSDEHQRLERQFNRVVRFAVLHSGQDIRSVLGGQFREVLELVIRDHLATEQQATDELRAQYIAGLKTKLLEPLRGMLHDHVSSMFPEIEVVDLLPQVRSLDETLSSVGIELGDIARTALTGKGTGVRGAVLVAMLRYLAEQSKRSLVLAVEEPEAFLHPGAQAQIASQLEDLAARAEVSLLVTTHSPHILSRKSNARVTELRKDSDGTTQCGGTARGDEEQAELLGSLFADSSFARVVDRATSIPAGTRAVVVTEGYTDDVFLRYGLAAAGRLDLIDGIYFIDAGGARKVPVQAVLNGSATDLPVLAVLDDDAHGRSAMETLEKFNWRSSEQILSLRQWPGRCSAGHDVEIEDLLPAEAAGRISEELGDGAHDSMVRCGSRMHYGYSDAWKTLALKRLPQKLEGTDCKNMVWLAEEINARIDKINRRAEKRKLHSGRGVGT